MTPQVFQGALNNTATKIYTTFIIIFHSGVSCPIEQHRILQPAVGLSQQPTVWLYQQPTVGSFPFNIDPLALSNLVPVLPMLEGHRNSIQ